MDTTKLTEGEIFTGIARNLGMIRPEAQKAEGRIGCPHGDELRYAIQAARDHLLSLPWPMSLRPALDALDAAEVAVPLALAEARQSGIVHSRDTGSLAEGREQAKNERCTLNRGR